MCKSAATTPFLLHRYKSFFHNFKFKTYDLFNFKFMPPHTCTYWVTSAVIVNHWSALSHPHESVHKLDFSQSKTSD